MSLKQTINDDLKAALKGGDRFVKQTLNMLRAAILNQEIALKKRQTGLDDTEIEQLIAKEVKKRQDSVRIYQQNNRLELADSEQREIDILIKYLPQQLSESEINQLIDELAATNQVELIPSNMGRLIGLVKQQTGASADGAMIAKLVRQKINN